MQTCIQRTSLFRRTGRTASRLAFALALLAAPAAARLHAQSSASPVTVSTTPGYANEVYYDLVQGVTKSAPLAEWDIAFQINGFASAIQINGGAGVRLYDVPGKTAADWNTTVDTAGMAATWKAWNNSTETWDLGAFNMGVDYNTGNFGWGEYNQLTHKVTGTTIYVIVLPDGTARKIMIDGLSSGTYSFRHASLDGSDEVTGSIVKAEFSGKGFGYYSLRDKKNVDHEPAMDQWDLVFGKYIALVGPNMDMPYGVTGVRLNQNVMATRVVTANPEMAPKPADDAFSSNITTIGYDWKTFTGSKYELDDSLAIFVKRFDNTIHRIVFTGFGGGTTGDIMFNQEQMSASSVKDERGGTVTAGIYPSVASANGRADLVYALERSVGNAQASIFDASGRLVGTQNLQGESGMHRASVNVPSTPGVYFVSLQFDGVVTPLRMVVR